MGRAILGVIVGYIVMAGVVIGSFAAAWMVFGQDSAYKEGLWEISTTWMIMMFVAGLIAAMIGGAVCAAIAAKGSKAAMVLAGLVLVLGFVDAGFKLAAPREDRPTVREDNVTMFEATANSQEPTVMLLGNPVIGLVGVLIGARLVGRKRAVAVG
ncbi:MAG: hypothetical protein IIC46_03410 [Planctomycetes bacterium]|nr:hypothetical protein [Planctomycetota bacterium]